MNFECTDQNAAYDAGQQSRHCKPHEDVQAVRGPCACRSLIGHASSMPFLIHNELCYFTICSFIFMAAEFQS
eukprot:1160601-Pelagomonas_calceolata.AAC.8